MAKEIPREEPSFIQGILMHYTFKGKLKVVAFIGTAVMAFLIYLLFTNLRKEISFTKLEIEGNKYQKTIYELLSTINKLKITLNGVKESSSKKELENKIEVLFFTLINIRTELQPELKNFSDHIKYMHAYEISPEELYKIWKNFLNSIDQSVETINQNYSYLIDSLQDLLIHVGDQSNLTYDPDISTHYLLESTLKSLPKEQDLISRILTLGLNIQDIDKISDKKKFEIITLTTVLLSNSYDTKSYIEKAIEEESNKKLSLESKNILANELKNYISDIETFTKYSEVTLAETYAESEINTFHPYFKNILHIDEHFSRETFTKLGITSLEQNVTLWNNLSDQIDKIFKIRIEEIKRQQSMIIAVVLICLGVAFIIGYVVIAEMNHFFKEVYSTVHKFSSGELSARIPESYDSSFEKIRLIVNELGDRIEALIDQLQQSGVQLTTTTTEITAAAKHQEGTICQQEATVKQILVTAGEISSTAKDFARTMNDVSKSAEETSSLASSGKEGLMQMEDTMRQMVEASKNIASKLAVLNDKAGIITSVITTITKVADQTNMLSFNASIEAEKAGEHGKSFAVIAREIRRLADQTANATLDIEKMVSEMMSAVTEGVMGVDKFGEEIRTGVQQVSKVSEQLTSIISQVQQQTSSFEYVNRGMQTQSIGAEQINESIMQLSDAAQETSISIRQFHTAIEQLTIASKEMQSCVARMKSNG